MRRIVDGKALNIDEQDAWDERVAICFYEGCIAYKQAELVADDMIRRMRRRKLEAKI